MALKTKPYIGLDPRAKDMHAREIVLTEANIKDVSPWLGKALRAWTRVSKNKSKLTIKTSKGERVAVTGDTIVKVGTRHNGNEPEFFVVKAE